MCQFYELQKTTNEKKENKQQQNTTKIERKAPYMTTIIQITQETMVSMTSMAKVQNQQRKKKCQRQRDGWIENINIKRLLGDESVLTRNLNNGLCKK